MTQGHEGTEAVWHAYQDWDRERYISNWADEGNWAYHYEEAEKSVTALTYALDEVPTLVAIIEDRLMSGGYRKLSGIFVSALLNRVLRLEDAIELHVDERFGFLGSFLRRGTVVFYPKHFEPEDTPTEYEPFENCAVAVDGATVVVNGKAHGRYGNCLRSGRIEFNYPVAGYGLSKVSGGHAVIRAFDTDGWYEGHGNVVADEQTGGLIEFEVDVPAEVYWLGTKQAGGMIKCLDVYSTNLGLWKTGGEIFYRNFYGDGTCGYRSGGIIETGTGIWISKRGDMHRMHNSPTLWDRIRRMVRPD
jgi:hypothetical protein